MTPLQKLRAIAQSQKDTVQNLENQIRARNTASIIFVEDIHLMKLISFIKPLIKDVVLALENTFESSVNERFLLVVRIQLEAIASQLKVVNSVLHPGADDDDDELG